MKLNFWGYSTVNFFSPMQRQGLTLVHFSAQPETFHHRRLKTPDVSQI
jgi:pullulanase/glycogen debranching enzyme